MSEIEAHMILFDCTQLPNVFTLKNMNKYTSVEINPVSR